MCYNATAGMLPAGGEKAVLKDDWAMNQILGFAKLLAKIKLDRDTTDYRVSGDPETDFLYFRLSEMLQNGLFNEAENLLFDEMDSGNANYLELAVDFYCRLNEMSDRDLEAGGFSREEIDDGLKETARIFGVSIL
jgi:hypothetical protein